MLIFRNIEYGENYKVDFPAIERAIEKLPEPDKKQCGEVISNMKKLGIDTLAYRYSVLVKMGCGHWEHLQEHHIDYLKDVVQPRCTKCVCGWNRA